MKALPSDHWRGASGRSSLPVWHASAGGVLAEVKLHHRAGPHPKDPHAAREPLMSGRWDSIADLVDGLDEVKERVAAIPYLSGK